MSLKLKGFLRSVGGLVKSVAPMAAPFMGPMGAPLLLASQFGRTGGGRPQISLPPMPDLLASQNFSIADTIGGYLPSLMGGAATGALAGIAGGPFGVLLGAGVGSVSGIVKHAIEEPSGPGEEEEEPEEEEEYEEEGEE